VHECKEFVVSTQRTGEPMVGVSVAGALDCGAALFREGEERFGGFSAMSDRSMRFGGRNAGRRD